ncbi:MAG: VWA domain-containing protein [Candidatus Aminicenantes bacterium]|nr:VWA domain-containing protein [Candidatus Aminicenantes bacterium]
MPDLCSTPPNFTLTNYHDNSSMSLTSSNGKVILLSFMSTACGHCINWMQHMQQIQNDYETNTGVQLIGVLFKAGGAVTPADVLAMITAAGITPTFSLLMDDGTVKPLYMSGLTGPSIGYPFSYIISPSYVIANKWHRLSTTNGDSVSFDSADPDDIEYFVRFRIDDLLAARDPWDTVLALDYSGTMNSSITIGTATQLKVDFLHEAVSTFLRVWKDYARCQDRIGIVYFDCNASSSGPLVQILSGNNIQTLIGAVEAKTANGCTAMGAALATGLGLLGSGSNKRFLVLFTDGMQNRNPLIYHPTPATLRIDNVATANYPPPLTGLCFCTSGDGGQSTYAGTLPVVLNGITIPIYTIGIGVPGSWQQMLQDISAATDPAGQFNADVDVWPNLKEFFIETLIDLFRSNSLQLVAKTQGTLSAGASSRVETFTLNKSVKKLTVLLSWVGNEAPLTFKLRKDGTSINLSHKVTEDITYRFATLSFPHYQETKRVVTPFRKFNLTEKKPSVDKMVAAADYATFLPLPWAQKELIGAEGNWEVIVERTFQGEQTSVPYHLMILADDTELKYTFSVPPHVFFAGDSIPVTIKASDSLKPIEKIFSAQVIVHKPTVVVDDLLAKYDAKRKTVQVDTQISRDLAPGPLGENIGKLMQDKKAMASLAKTKLETVSLQKASKTILTEKTKDLKGLFRGFYGNTHVPGIYKLDFKIKGVGERCGVFERVESRTVLVMPKSVQKIAKKKGRAGKK